MYRKIEARMWTDPKFRRLKSNEKLVFLYLITCPGAHVSGVYYLSIPAGCDETGLDEVDFRYCIDTLSSSGLIKFDQESSTVWVVNMLRYQGRGDKIAKCVATQLEDLHADAIIEEFMRYYKSFSIPYRKGIDTAPIGKPEKADQDQDQEQDQEEEKPSDSSPPSTSTPRIGEFSAQAMQQALDSRGAHPASTPPDRSPPRAMLPDRRAGGLTPELEELRHTYAAAWGVDPALVPLPAGDDLQRVRMALSDEQAGLTNGERIENAYAAIRGHHREASKDGSSYGRDLIHVFPPLRDGNKTKTRELNFSRYMAFARAGQAARVPEPTAADLQDRAAEKAMIEETSTEEGMARRKKKAGEARALFNKTSKEAGGKGTG